MTKKQNFIRWRETSGRGREVGWRGGKWGGGEGNGGGKWERGEWVLDTPCPHPHRRVKGISYLKKISQKVFFFFFFFFLNIFIKISK